MEPKDDLKPVAEKENFVNSESKTLRKSFTDEQSSNVREIEYFPSVKHLKVTFKGGSRYQYNDVPQEVFDQALDAISIGSFFSSKIKRVYQCEKIT